MLRKLWLFLDGKKTILGFLIKFGCQYLHANGHIDLGTCQEIESKANYIIAVGFGDKARKYFNK